MKLKKNNWIHLAVLTLMYLTMVLVITGFKYAYGSELDWSAQHFAIPDNFRREFYRTGNIFPSFVFNVGAGENIYDLSYYGSIYTIDGIKVAQPQRGINIVRTVDADGKATVRRILVK